MKLVQYTVVMAASKIEIIGIYNEILIGEAEAAINFRTLFYPETGSDLSNFVSKMQITQFRASRTSQ